MPFGGLVLAGLAGAAFAVETPAQKYAFLIALVVIPPVVALSGALRLAIRRLWCPGAGVDALLGTLGLPVSAMAATLVLFASNPADEREAVELPEVTPVADVQGTAPTKAPANSNSKSPAASAPEAAADVQLQPAGIKTRVVRGKKSFVVDAQTRTYVQGRGGLYLAGDTEIHRVDVRRKRLAFSHALPENSAPIEHVAACHDGSAVVVATDGHVTKVSMTGELDWSRAGSPATAVQCATDGTVVVPSADKIVHYDRRGLVDTSKTSDVS